MNQLPTTLSDMTIEQLEDYLSDIELDAQDAWSNSELAALRRERDSARAELNSRKS